MTIGDPEQLVVGAVRHRPDFPPAPADAPKPDWNYSNTGYVLAGVIIEKATGRPWAEEVRDRIIRPLGLTGTYAPGDDPYLKPPHAYTYHLFPGSVTWTDTTARNISPAQSSSPTAPAAASSCSPPSGPSAGLWTVPCAPVRGTSPAPGRRPSPTTAGSVRGVAGAGRPPAKRFAPDLFRSRSWSSSSSVQTSIRSSGSHSCRTPRSLRSS
ncbi:serine hydrolase [Streptomyces tendae]|uniref:serine hydrolase n=1 Tax=Streptomyces tendae TaxID=1932 RepID=UPI003801E6AB